jgi:hypothetical protein
MKCVLYTKSNADRQRFVNEWTKDISGNSVFYFCPKKFVREYKSLFPLFNFTALEDITKTQILLTVNSKITPESVIILDSISRYNKVTSAKFKHLHRLCRLTEHRYLIDAVPFIDNVEYLYVPLSYIDREILRFQHYYAFRENYNETTSSGEVVRAHDYNLLTDKLTEHAHTGYDRFTHRSRAEINCYATDAELEAYFAKKDQLFEKYNNVSPIITRLSDFAHAFTSRADKIKEIAAALTGTVAIITNLKSYAERHRDNCFGLPARVVPMTYYEKRYDFSNIDHIIYAESPIVKNYLLLDIEAMIPEHCSVYHIVGDAKVDTFLSNAIIGQLKEIDKFMSLLYAKQ